jgi:hypothetical protein
MGRSVFGVLLLFFVGGQIGAAVVERQCSFEYLVPRDGVSKAAYYAGTRPLDGWIDMVNGLTSGWPKACGEVRFEKQRRYQIQVQ